MTNQERVNATLKNIDDMFENIPDLSCENEVLSLANLTSISMCLRDISLSLAVIADKETDNHV